MSKGHFISNLCGTQSKSDLAKVGVSRSVNMFQETTDQDQNSFTRVMRSIYGMKEFVSIPGTPRGMFTVSRGYQEKPTLYAVFDTSLYVIIKNEFYKIGELAQANSICHFCETGGYGDAHPHLIIVDGENVYAVNTGLSPSDQSIDFKHIKLPLRTGSKTVYIQPTHCAYMYGYLIVNDAGTDAFYTSYQYPFETNIGTETDPLIDYDLFQTEKYNGYGFVTYSEWMPDKTLAICSNGSRLYTFGDKSYQVFTYNDDVNYPFQSPDTAAKLIGIKAVNSLAQLGEYTFWLGSADLGNNGIYMNTGSIDSQRISTPDIEREIASLKYINDGIGQIWQENQHIFYCISFPSSKKSFVYDVKESTWHERCSLDDKNNETYWRYKFASLSPDGDLVFATKDCIVKQDKENYKEHDNKPLLRKRIGGMIYSNHNNFYIDVLTIEMNNGQTPKTNNEDNYISMRYTADGIDWTDLEMLNVGRAGEYDYDCTFYSFGMAKHFSIELSTTYNIPFSLYGLNVVTQEVNF